MRQRRSAVGGATAKSFEALSVPGGFRVEVIRREGARRMVDVGPKGPVWLALATTGASILGHRVVDSAVAALTPAGALVRVRPPPDVPPERVERLRALLVEAGAAAIKILPPAASHAVAPREVEASVTRGIRETVTLVAASARTMDRGRLDAVLEAALAAEGI